MKKIVGVTLLLMLFTNLVWSQTGDTTVVQTLEFTDITKRRGWYVFPPDTSSYEKILMYYTLKCDAQTTQDNYNCGEWDYTTYTNLYQYLNLGDTVYWLGNTSPDTVFYGVAPSYNVYQRKEYEQVIDGTTAENQINLVNGTTTSSNILGTEEVNKVQYVLLATDLQTAGLVTGDVHRMRINLDALAEVDHFTVKMKNSSLTEVTPASFESSGFTEVYNNSIDLNAGDNVLNFISPFYWDGTSNVVIEISHNSQAAMTVNESSTVSSYNSGVMNGVNRCLEFSGDDFVQVPATALSTLSDELTISFWCYGTPEAQPMNNYTLEGRDANGNRVVNVHLPWGNGEVYWDCGNSGTNGYDRVNAAATTDQYEGQWNHWAFTKNATTGDMVVYVNGTVFASGTGKTRVMSPITTFKIGGNASNELSGNYEGKMDEFRIWDKELSQSEIQAYMYQMVDGSHPQISNLLLAYAFDEVSGVMVNDYSGNGNHGEMLGYPARRMVSPTENYFNLVQLTSLPELDLYQGVYTTHLDSTTVGDTLWNSLISVVKDLAYRDIAVSGLSYTRQDTVSHYPYQDSYTYDPDGNVIATVSNPVGGYYVNTVENITHQIQNYVTPYGIGLDLGPDGFRWIYDVTDYEPILHDTVEISAGNQQELIDLKFVFIKGTPPRNVEKFETIWLGDYQHSDIANDVVMQAVDRTLESNASQFIVRTRTTGHWFGGFENCAEFCPKTHHIKVNGTQTHSWLNWKKCANNPVKSQGGTWVYDRAGWCPGTFADTYDHDITDYVTPGANTSIDYGMQTTAGGMEGNYRVTVQLMQYSAPNFQTDARVEDIIAPNDWEYHQNYNPMCDNPKIMIRNTGADQMTSAKIGYWVCGGDIEYYTWTGSLDFMDTITVELPIPDQSFWDHANYCNLFHAEVFEVNGGADDYSANNHQQSTFQSPPTIPGDLILWYKSNNSPNENELYIFDDQGTVVYQNINATANTWYKDTIPLSPGCYKLQMTDSGEDGLSFFANTAQGSGNLYLRKFGGGTHIAFDSDFGSELIYYFTSGYTLGTEELGEEIDAKIYPNPNNGLFTLETDGMVGEVTLTIYNNVGAQVSHIPFNAFDLVNKESIDLSTLAKGTYTVRLAYKDYVKVIPVVLY